MDHAYDEYLVLALKLGMTTNNDASSFVGPSLRLHTSLRCL
jgi:hypothetical protein